MFVAQLCPADREGQGSHSDCGPNEQETMIQMRMKLLFFGTARVQLAMTRAKLIALGRAAALPLAGPPSRRR